MQVGLLGYEENKSSVAQTTKVPKEFSESDDLLQKEHEDSSGQFVRFWLRRLDQSCSGLMLGVLTLFLITFRNSSWVLHDQHSKNVLSKWSQREKGGKMEKVREFDSMSSGYD